LLTEYDIEPKSPDDFVREQIDLSRDTVYAAVQQIADSWHNPPGTIDDVLDRLERSGLLVMHLAARSAALLTTLLLRLRWSAAGARGSAVGKGRSGR
jgi:hypothetical protein